MPSRRQVLLRIAPLAGAAFVWPRAAWPQQIVALKETDPMAVAMGFRLDTTKVDQKKYPKHTIEQHCANCVHFTTPGANEARCNLFNKLVPKTGWCSGYSKRV